MHAVIAGKLFRLRMQWIATGIFTQVNAGVITSWHRQSNSGVIICNICENEFAKIYHLAGFHAFALQISDWYSFDLYIYSMQQGRRQEGWWACQNIPLSWCLVQFSLHMMMHAWSCPFVLNYDRSTVKHARQNTQNYCYQWLSNSSRVHQIRFWPGLYPGPLWGRLQCSPRPPSWFKGACF